MGCGWFYFIKTLSYFALISTAAFAFLTDTSVWFSPFLLSTLIPSEPTSTEVPLSVFGISGLGFSGTEGVGVAGTGAGSIGAEGTSFLHDANANANRPAKITLFIILVFVLKLKITDSKIKPVEHKPLMFIKFAQKITLRNEGSWQ
jgi:hypothetical protein